MHGIKKKTNIMLNVLMKFRHNRDMESYLKSNSATKLLAKADSRDLYISTTNCQQKNFRE